MRQTHVPGIPPVVLDGEQRRALARAQRPTTAIVLRLEVGHAVALDVPTTSCGAELVQRAVGEDEAPRRRATARARPSARAHPRLQRMHERVAVAVSRSSSVSIRRLSGRLRGNSSSRAAGEHGPPLARARRRRPTASRRGPTGPRRRERAAHARNRAGDGVVDRESGVDAADAVHERDPRDSRRRCPSTRAQSVASRRCRRRSPLPGRALPRRAARRTPGTSPRRRCAPYGRILRPAPDTSCERYGEVVSTLAVCHVPSASTRRSCGPCSDSSGRRPGDRPLPAGPVPAGSRSSSTVRSHPSDRYTGAAVARSTTDVVPHEPEPPVSASDHGIVRAVPGHVGDLGEVPRRGSGRPGRRGPTPASRARRHRRTGATRRSLGPVGTGPGRASPRRRRSRRPPRWSRASCPSPPPSGGSAPRRARRPGRRPHRTTRQPGGQDVGAGEGGVAVLEEGSSVPPQAAAVRQQGREEEEAHRGDGIGRSAGAPGAPMRPGSDQGKRLSATGRGRAPGGTAKGGSRRCARPRSNVFPTQSAARPAS